MIPPTAPDWFESISGVLDPSLYINKNNGYFFRLDGSSGPMCYVFSFTFPQNWLDVVCCSGFPVLNDVHCNAALCNEDCSWLIFLRASTWAESKKILWIWQNPKYPTQYTKMEVTSWYQITLYAFQFMICPSLWNEVQLPNIKIFLKRKWYCPKFGQIFFFSGKHLSPRLQK